MNRFASWQMGPSGSGKTSLLNVLAQRVPQKHVTGNVFVDGSPLSKSFKRRMGFVFQASGVVESFRAESLNARPSLLSAAAAAAVSCLNVRRTTRGVVCASPPPSRVVGPLGHVGFDQ